MIYHYQHAAIATTPYLVSVKLCIAWCGPLPTLAYSCILKTCLTYLCLAASTGLFLYPVPGPRNGGMKAYLPSSLHGYSELLESTHETHITMHLLHSRGKTNIERVIQHPYFPPSIVQVLADGKLSSFGINSSFRVPSTNFFSLLFPLPQIASTTHSNLPAD